MFSLLSSCLFFALGLLEISVPKELLSKTTMPEASGILWHAPLSAYLVVSDDTGRKELGTHHAPWLFVVRPGPGGSKGQNLAMDPEVVEIAGIDKLNDAEAICAGPSGGFLVLTSHSKNKAGKIKESRRQILHLRLDGKKARIVGTLEIGDALTRLFGDAAVDLEGMDVHNGVLYLGLKAPLSATGQAQILALLDYEKALQAGKAEKLQVAAQVSLAAATKDGPAPRGIADLRFLKDGSLVLLANSPKGGIADGGGASFFLRSLAKPAEVRLVATYPGLKPEGVTLSADGSSLVIVFDRDQAPPQWVKEEIPK